MDKKQSTILDLDNPGETKVITLKTEPERAKPKDYTSKAGKAYKKWTYFTTNDEVFFAFGDLHRELCKYKAGDTLSLEYIVPVGEKYGKHYVKLVSPAPSEAPKFSASTKNDGLEELKVLVKQNNSLLLKISQALQVRDVTARDTDNGSEEQELDF